MATVATPADHYVRSRGIAAGEVIAFRAWKVLYQAVDSGSFPPVTTIRMGPRYVDLPALVSYSRDYVWQPGVNRAHQVPAENNSSGFYALKDHNAILDYWGTSDAWYCLGAVELWGEVIEGTLGYRAEFAAVQNLFCLVRARSRPPRVINGGPAWRAAVERAWGGGYGIPTFDEEAGGVEREYDNDGPLITALRRRYLG